MKYSLLFLFLCFLFSGFSGDESLYQWRGSERNGISNETSLLKTWPADGPSEIWSIDNIGNGFVSPVFAGNNFYITGEIDSMAILFCFNLKGEKVWQTTLGREWTKSLPGSRSHPTILGNLLYVGTGIGNLYCVDRNTGKIIWTKELARDFQGILPLHGHAEAPLIDGDKVFWTPGGKEFNVVALNRLTGNLIWSNKGFSEPSGYNSPKLIQLKSRKIIITFSSYHLLGLDAATGKMLFFHEQDNTPPDKRTPGNGDTHSNTVLYEDGSIYYAEGDGNCGVKLTLAPDGSSVKEVWRNKGFDSYMGGVIKAGNYMYCGAVARPQLVSIDATTGQLTDSLKVGTGALISADNMLYYYNQKGEFFLISYKNGDIEKVSSFKITKGTMQHFSHPVINNGVLYQRHGKTLMAFNIKQK